MTRMRAYGIPVVLTDAETKAGIADLRKAIIERYPHIMEPPARARQSPNAYGVDTVSVSSRYKIREKKRYQRSCACGRRAREGLGEQPRPAGYL